LAQRPKTSKSFQWLRPRDAKALSVVDPELAQRFQRFDVLDVLRDGLDSQRVPDFVDRFDDRMIEPDPERCS